MAPSLRKPAPSSSATRGAAKPKIHKNQAQLPLKSALNNASFGRVTKTRSQKVTFSDVQKSVFAEWDENETEDKSLGEDVKVLEPEIVSKTLVILNHGSKRKRGHVSDCESESESSDSCGSLLSKTHRAQTRVQLLSPPASRDGTDCDEHLPLKADFGSIIKRRCVEVPANSAVELPQILLDLISMHAAFLKALSLHYAHNGASSPAELGALMESMTRLWKKSCIRRDAIQKMLGLYEVASDSTLDGSQQVEQKYSPFSLVTSGLGSNVRINLEYVAQQSYNEFALQTAYSKMAYAYFQGLPVSSSINVPSLIMSLGTQTSIYRAKASSTRAEILKLSNSAQSRSTPDFSKLSISDPADHTPAAVKSRTLSLFDRVRAKGLAAMKNAAPTSAQIARRHAIGRISEVVEFLRMKQQQKLSTQYHTSVDDDPGQIKGTGKISFSLGAIVRDIQQSVGVPIGAEEIRLCLTILSEELPGDWCRTIQLGSVVSITLKGNGVSGIEARKLLENKVVSD